MTIGFERHISTEEVNQPASEDFPHGRVDRILGRPIRFVFGLLFDRPSQAWRDFPQTDSPEASVKEQIEIRERIRDMVMEQEQSGHMIPESPPYRKSH